MSGNVLAGDIVSYTCHVKYAGNIAPQMHWSGTMRPVVQPRDESVKGSVAKITGAFMIAKADDGKTFTCDTFFDKYNPKDKDDATNKIANTYKWTSEPFIVRCKYSLHSGGTCVIIRFNMKSMMNARIIQYGSGWQNL